MATLDRYIRVAASSRETGLTARPLSMNAPIYQPGRSTNASAPKRGALMQTSERVGEVPDEGRDGRVIIRSPRALVSSDVARHSF